MNNLAPIIERVEKIKVELENLEAQFEEGKHWAISSNFRDASYNVMLGIEGLIVLARRGVDNARQSGE